MTEDRSARLELDAEFIDPALDYDGPAATAATVTESLYWPLSDRELQAELEGQGWQLTWSGRVPTPYGLGPAMTAWSTPSKRVVLWIRDYGRTPGGELRHRQLSERLFWVLWRAGVRFLLAGTHAGIADWRYEDRITPGDLVLPWSFESRPWFNGLPGTPYESTMNNPMVMETREIPWPYVDEPFSAEAGLRLLEIVRPLVEAGHIGRTWTPAEVRAVTCDVENIGFESHYDVAARMAISRMISEMQPDRPPVVTLHGVTINPVLCRLLAIENLQYQSISNPAPGVTPTIEETHDQHVYDISAARRWVAVEAAMLDTYPPLSRGPGRRAPRPRG
jgi:hypothetical protein